MTSIEWTDITDNIFVVKGGGWFCQKIGDDCDNCYAESINGSSFFGGNGLKYQGPAPDIELCQPILDRWPRMRVPKNHFVASMTDIFGQWVKQEHIFKFLDAMYFAPKQTFQMLTKRPGLANTAIRAWLNTRGLPELPRHMWIGASIGRQKYDSRLAHLIDIPAAVRFVSAEPLLEALDLTPFLYRLHWVIVGGESGHGARHCIVDAVHQLVQQCAQHRVPCFVKQLGARPIFDAHSAVNVFPGWNPPVFAISIDHPTACATLAIKLKHPKGGDPSEWAASLRVRQFPS